MPNLKSARSFLFVPGDRPERFAKAAAAGAHAIIIDLEDAVSPETKVKARYHAQNFLDNAVSQDILIRINGTDSEFHDEDLALASHKNLAGIILPKAEAKSCSELTRRSGTPVWPLIETVHGLVDLREIVTLQNLGRLLLGTIDLSMDLGVDISHAASQSTLDTARFMLVSNSRLGNLPSPVDGVFTNLNDEIGLQRAAEHARASGMGGMMCIHPRQTKIINTAFSPNSSDFEWANAVLQASKTEKSSFQFRGQMVDKPVLARAQQILEAQQAQSS